MKKKILALCLVVVLAVTAVTSATLAYFTDKDADKNTFVVGNVKIVQNEEQRPVDDDGEYTNGAVIGFVDDQALVPAVIPDGSESGSYDGTITVAGGKEYKIWDASINGEIDKFISVTNKGTEEAYVRTIIAFEDDATCTLTPALHTSWGFNADGTYVEATAKPNKDGEWVELPDADVVWLQDANGNYLTIGLGDGTLHSVAVVTYDVALAAGETSKPSLMQLWLDPAATNEWSAKVDKKYTIYAASLAVQADGFKDASTAMDTAFDLTKENLVSWLSGAIKTDDSNNVVGGTVTE